ncbi:hypothetical protein HBI56_217250 [Parastagonospora nodorum]|uniref:Uncharacterized protein n=1 Tax=Phaeosphaeria nodorum (strain SN15 / ATCC MYA-4574 / FGSC 10173) TaxID=321614 RepID=A0A7U2F0T2_PHANO|nr:hypothetical protein HBH56_175380 [Parastagonospora nodorum]QRC96277.1 hypothetical protein JI435_408590 [Parastagonospora nodorum SN15]KAH3926325.1 hypothetical protein HBH54_167780 [Parastagonospora nodorum]KAH3955802.1 hypothetical protein HBH53_000600 [Parastagonospora nodorum]KAH3965514.1 hypothetical protein HBH52_204440 [Parastagonospora nodorum]
MALRHGFHDKELHFLPLGYLLYFILSHGFLSMRSASGQAHMVPRSTLETFSMSKGHFSYWNKASSHLPEIDGSYGLPNNQLFSR